MTDTAAPPATIQLLNRLRQLGVANEQTAQRLANLLASKGFSHDNLPNSTHGDAVFALFMDLIPSARLELGEALAIAAGIDVDKGGWPHWLHRQLEAAEHEDEIGRRRADFNTAMADTLAAMARVNQIRQQLITLHDVEIAESSDLFPTHLAAADLALRTAAALNPVKEG